MLNLWYPYAYFNSQWQRRGLPLPAVVRLDLRRASRTTPGRRRSGRSPSPRSHSPSRGAACAGLHAGDATQDDPKARRRSNRRARAGSRRDLRRPNLGRGSGSAPCEATPLPRGQPPRCRQARVRAGAPLALVALACVFGLVVLRGETTPAAEPQRQRVPPPDGALGRRPDRRGARAARRLVSRTCRSARRFFHHYQSLPHTLTAYTARVTGAGDESTYLWIQYLLLALWPISVYLAARLLDWEQVDCGGRGRRLAADRQRTRLRLRARQLHLAGVRRLLAAVGDVAASDRLGTDVARGRARAGTTRPRRQRSRSRSRATSSPATWRC